MPSSEKVPNSYLSKNKQKSHFKGILNNFDSCLNQEDKFKKKYTILKELLSLGHKNVRTLCHEKLLLQTIIFNWTYVQEANPSCNLCKILINSTFTRVTNI